MSERYKAIRAVLLVFGVFIGGLLLANGGGRWIYNHIPEAGYKKQERERAEWERYKIEQGCVLTGNTQTSTTYGGTHLTRHSSTTHYREWKCRGGDLHWEVTP